ncbi:MAG: hypothetical protein KDK38_00415 [Leptospiraceae bacterium]|nr:hypothetical protein [Leptospiraceae bacterium]
MSKLLYFIFLLSIGVVFWGGWLSAPSTKTLKLNSPQTEALRREMIDMDIQLRSLASLISLGYRIPASDAARHLSDWQNENHPRMKEAFAQLVGEFKRDNTLTYATQVFSSAKQISSILKASKSPDWNLVQNHLSKILQNCRNCHVIYDVKY